MRIFTPILATALLTVAAIACGKTPFEGNFEGTLSMPSSGGYSSGNGGETAVNLVVKEGRAKNEQDSKVFGTFTTNNGLSGRFDGDWKDKQAENLRFFFNVPSGQNGAQSLPCGTGSVVYVGSFKLDRDGGNFSGTAKPETASPGQAACSASLVINARKR